MKQLTIKQKILLDAIMWFINERGYSPTIKELSEMTKSSPRPVFDKLSVLEELGYISTENGKARTIKVLKGIE